MSRGIPRLSKYLTVRTRFRLTVRLLPPWALGRMCSICTDGTPLALQYAHWRPLFLQQVLAQVVAEQGALLVFDAGDFWVLQGLHVKTHKFAVERGDLRPALDAQHPSYAGVHPVLEWGCQPPALLVASIEKM